MSVRKLATAALGCWLSWNPAGYGQPLTEGPIPDLGPSQGILQEGVIRNQDLADLVARHLREARQLKGYRAQISVKDGIVELRGYVNQPAQRDEILQVVREVPGVRNVVDRMEGSTETLVQAQAPGVPPEFAPPQGQVPPTSAIPQQMMPQQMMPHQMMPQQAPNMPMMGQPGMGYPGMGMPMMGGYPQQGFPGMAPMGQPVMAGQGFQPPAPQPYNAPQPVAPAQPGGPGNSTGQFFEPAPISGPTNGAQQVYQQPPPLPPYAWPTYAPYNNYSRVAYPQTYQYDAFPYIGPIYPFPKVPLGWRSVSLTWEDGYWWFAKKPTAHDWWRIRYR